MLVLIVCKHLSEDGLKNYTRGDSSERIGRSSSNTGVSNKANEKKKIQDLVQLVLLQQKKKKKVDAASADEIIVNIEIIVCMGLSNNPNSRNTISFN